MVTTHAPLPAFGKVRNRVQVIHVACIGSLIAIGATFWVLHGQVNAKDFPESGVLLAIGAAVSIGALVTAAILPKFSPAGRPDAPLVLRIQGLYVTQVMFAALIESAGLYWAVLVLILGQPAYLVGSMLALVVLGVYFPTQSRIEEQLAMSEDRFEAEVARLNGASGRS